jgi:WD40 repeat protein
VLDASAPSYVERAADHKLFSALCEGELCYLLDTRQVGKTSLLARCGYRLRQQGHTVVLIDLSVPCDTTIDPDAWYLSLLTPIARATGTTADCLKQWEVLSNMPPVLRWRQVLEIVILSALSSRLYLFFDEIDALQKLTFPTDPFLGSLRELYQRRHDQPPLDRLTCCLAGAVAPTQLIRNPLITPFNVGTAIELTDFTSEEASPLRGGLGQNGSALLQGVLHWTGGHPYLTQFLCQILVDCNAQSRKDVDRLCREQFLHPSARESDHNLQFIRNRVLASQDPAALLGLYLQARRRHLHYDPIDPLTAELRLCGLVVAQRNRLTVRNRIYRRAFDERWAHSLLEPAEVARQRRALWAGIGRATILYGALTALVLLAGLFWRASTRAKVIAQEAQLTRSQLTQASRQLAQEQSRLKQVQRERVTLDALRRQSMKRLSKAQIAESHAVGEMRKAQQQLAEIQRTLAESKGKIAHLDQAIQAGAARLVRTQKQAAVAEQERLALVRSRQELLWRFGPARTTSEERELLSLMSHQVTQEPSDLSALDRLRQLVTRPFYRRLRLQIPFVPRSQRFSPDGKSLLVAGESDRALLLDAATGALQESLPLAPDSIATYADISPDGRWVVVGCTNGEVRLWDRIGRGTKGPPLQILQAGPQARLIGAISPDSQLLFYSRTSSGGILYRLGSGTSVEVVGHGKPITCADFTAGATVTGLVTGDSGGTVQPWSVDDGRPCGTMVRKEEPITALIHSGVYEVAFATKGGEFTSYQWQRVFNPIQGYRLNRGSPTHVARVGELVLAITDESALQLWNYGSKNNGSLLSLPPSITYASGSAELTHLTTSPSGQCFALASDDKTIQIWQMGTRLIPNGFGFPNHAEFSPDGKALLTATSEGHVRLNSVESGVLLWEGLDNPRRVDAYCPPMHQATFLKQPNQCVTSDKGGRLQLWSFDGSPEYMGTGKKSIRFVPLRTDRAHKGPIYTFSYSSKRDLLVTAGQDKRVNIYETRTWKRLHSLPAGDNAYSCRLSPDARRVAVVCSDGGTRLFDTDSGALLDLLLPPGRTLGRQKTRPRDVEFTPDGALLAVGETDGRVRIWERKRLVGEFAGPGGAVVTLSFSPDGQWLALGRGSRGVELYHWPTTLLTLRQGRRTTESFRLEVGGDTINTVRFSPDGDWLAVASRDGIARILPITAHACLKEGREMLKRLVGDKE